MCVYVGDFGVTIYWHAFDSKIEESSPIIIMFDLYQIYAKVIKSN